MAYSNRNILITPNIGNSVQEPIIAFNGGGASNSGTQYVRVLDTGVISFEGVFGQNLSINDGPLNGYLFQVNDQSGIPSFTVASSGAVGIAQYQGQVFLGNNTASVGTGSGALQVLGGVGISGNLNIGGSFSMSANLGVGGAGGTYAITAQTSTNVAAYFTDTADGSSMAIQIGASTYPLGIGFNSYNNVGTTYVSAAGGYNAHLQLNGASGLQFLVSSASQSANAIATQINAMNITAGTVTIPLSTAGTAGTTGTGALIVYGGVGIGGTLSTAGDAYLGAVRVGTGGGSLASNTVVGNAAGAGLAGGGASNTLIGYQAGTALTSSGQNTAIGYQALVAQTATAGANTAIGYQTMYSSNNSAMQNNTAIGYRAMGLGNGGFYNNTGIGYYALANLSSGYQNTAIGYNAGNNVGAGASNTLIGYGAGTSLVAQNNVVIIGGNNGGTASSNYVVISDGVGNIRLQADASGNVSIPSTTLANGTAGTGALVLGTGGASIAGGLTLGGALYVAGSAGTSGYALTSTGTGLQWAQTGISITNDNSTNATRYLLFTNSVSGTLTTEYVDSTHLLYNPSLGSLSSTIFNGIHNGAVGVGTGATPAAGSFTTINGNNQLTISNTSVTHNITGQTSGALTLNNNSVGNGGGVCLQVSGSGDINISSGGSLFFGNYSYASGSYIQGFSAGEVSIFRTGTKVAQTNGTGAFQVNGVLYVTSDFYSNYSDIRLKTVLEPLSSASAKLRTLDTFTYVNNDLANELGQDSSRKQVGLSAQQVLEVQPEAVGIAPFDVDENGESKSGENYLAVQYDKLVPLVIAGHNEHSDEIAGLRAEIAELKALVSQLLNK